MMGRNKFNIRSFKAKNRVFKAEFHFDHFYMDHPVGQQSWTNFHNKGLLKMHSKNFFVDSTCILLANEEKSPISTS